MGLCQAFQDLQFGLVSIQLQRQPGVLGCQTGQFGVGPGQMLGKPAWSGRVMV
jgi:hypothetical protein